VRLPKRSAGLEFGAMVLLLTALAVFAYGSHVLHGGFLSDMWSNRSLFVFAPEGGFFDTVSYVNEQPNIAPRPLQGLYLVLLNEVFGDHVRWWLAWLVAGSVLMSSALFLLLLRLRMPAFDAAAIAALVLIFPAATSIRFWLATIWAPLSITFVILGFLLALIAFDAKRPRAKLALHGASLGFFVASVLLYEVALLVMLSSVLLYLLQVPWRTAAKRWAVDCAVLIAITLTVTIASSSGHEESEAGAWTHGVKIFSQAREMLATIVLPFGSAFWYVLLLVALVPLVALLVHRWLPSTDPARSELRRWLTAMVGGAVVVVLGYVVYAPGTDYYIPMGPGIADRVNAVPSIGWVLILYAGAMLIGTIAFRDLPRARRLSSGLAALICALIAIGWLKTVDTYSDYFTRAYAEDLRVLSVIDSALPEPRPHSTIWTFGQPVEIVPGVPVFGNTWDMTGSVRLNFGDPTLSSYVAAPGVSFFCNRHGVAPGGTYAVDGAPAEEFGSPYGRTYFLDTTTGRMEPLNSAAQCRHAARTFAPSPQYPLAG
jgi:hypothetical protein